MPSLTIVLSLITSADAATILVPDNFPTAQGAVNAAASGDIISFTADVTENFTVSGKNLTFTSTNLNSSWVGNMTVTGGANVIIQSLHVDGGRQSIDPDQIELGQFCQTLTPTAVTVVNATLNVIDATFTCFSLGAILSAASDITITDSDFRYNYYGGAVSHVGSDLIVDNSTFEYNSGTGQGGAISSQGVLTRISGSGFYANSANGGLGGGLFVASDELDLWGNEFNNNFNLIWFIPGIVINDPADLLGVGGDVAGLAVGLGDGAGAYVTNPAGGTADVDIWNNMFSGNLADAGAGLYIDDVRSAIVQNNRFAENWAMHYGGAMYIEASTAWLPDEAAFVVNNTFLLNTAGLIPPPFTSLVTVIGGGGGLAFDGTIVDFRNNILALTPFGAGIMGIDGPDYTIGDLLTMDFNILFDNCDDIVNCVDDDPLTWQHFSGDLNQISLPVTNIQLDPFPTYFGGGDFNSTPDAFYPLWGSPAVRNGDAVNEPNIYSPNFSDIGAYGGPRADVLDRDGDTFENIYDCNDEAPPGGGAGVFPGAPEVCDGFDNDCDGLIDEGFDTLWYIDNDGDTYGDVNQVQPLVTCAPPANHVLNRDDCADGDPGVNPGQQELCDGLDNDCDFSRDGGLPFLALWEDLDGDRYGAGLQFNGCSAQDLNAGPDSYYITEAGLDPYLVVSGFVSNADDCNDFNANISPVAAEVCDDLDNDCNLIVDDAQNGGRQYYIDGDGDGFGTGIGVYGCNPPDSSSVTAGGDCDDFNVQINPNADEICDGVDNDCDATTDQNAVNAPLLYEDLDNDGLGNPATAVRNCNPGPSYTTEIGNDCDDNDPTIGECVDCGCQSSPTPGGVGGVGALLGLLLAARRRRTSVK